MAGSGDGRFTAFDYSIGNLGGERVETVEVPSSAWNERHRHRLARTSSIAGLVPMVGIERTGDRSRLVQYAPESDSLAGRLASPSRPEWSDSAGAVSAAARAVHAGHLDGLAHGSLSPEDVRIHGDDVAVAGMGLGAGAALIERRRRWAAPEVLAGEAPSARSDVYSLGKVLEEGLASAGSSTDVPPELAEVARQATSESPSMRPVSARALAASIDEAAGPSRKAYGLAALGATPGFRRAVEAARADGFASLDSDPATAGAAASGGAAVGLARLAAGGAAAAAAADGVVPGSSTGGSPSGGARPASSAAAGGDRGRKGWLWAGAALLGAGAIGYAATRDGSDADGGAEVAGVTTEQDSSTEGSASAEASEEGAATDEPGGDDTAAASTSSTETATSTTGAATTTEAAVTNETTASAESTASAETTSETTAGDEADGDEDPAATTTSSTEAPTTEATATEAASGGPAVDGEAIDAAVAAESYEILHAIGGRPLDVYVDGSLAGAGLEGGQALSPLPAQAAALKLFDAVAEPAADVTEREDEPVAEIEASGEPGVLVAHLQDAGIGATEVPVDLTAVPAGEGRLSVVTLLDGAASVAIDGTSVDGTTDDAASDDAGTDDGANGDASSGAARVAAVLAAGPHQVAILDGAGEILATETIDVTEGEVTTAVVAPTAEGSPSFAVRRVTGVGSAPTGVPSGNSGLASGDGQLPLVAAVMAALTVAGSLVRRRTELAADRVRLRR